MLARVIYFFKEKNKKKEGKKIKDFSSPLLNYCFQSFYLFR